MRATKMRGIRIEVGVREVRRRFDRGGETALFSCLRPEPVEGSAKLLLTWR